MGSVHPESAEASPAAMREELFLRRRPFYARMPSSGKAWLHFPVGFLVFENRERHRRCFLSTVASHFFTNRNGRPMAECCGAARRLRGRGLRNRQTVAMELAVAMRHSGDVGHRSRAAPTVEEKGPETRRIPHPFSKSWTSSMESSRRLRSHARSVSRSAALRSIWWPVAEVVEQSVKLL